MDHEDGDGDGAGLHGGDDGEVLAVDVDDEHAGGGVEPSGGDSGSVSPLRSSPAVAF